MPTVYYIDQLRERLAEEFPGTQFFFQPADIVSQILNFGVPAPIDLQLVGNNMQANYRLAQQINRPHSASCRAPWTCTSSSFSPRQPYILDVDRTRAQTVGLSEQDVANSLLLTLSSSFQINPSFWVNPGQRDGIQRGRAGAAV